MHIAFFIVFFLLGLGAIAWAKQTVEAENLSSDAKKKKLIGVAGLLVLVLIGAVATYDDYQTGGNQTLAAAPAEADGTELATASAQVEVMKPETVVRFPEATIACLSKEALLAITAHFVRGEKTKGLAYFQSKENPNGPCVTLEPQKTYKVLSVEYNNPDMPDLGIMEIVGMESKSPVGAWAFTTGANRI